MLKEKRNVSQHTGEPFRRFFFDDYLQLYVWYGPAGQVTGFELAYDLFGEGRAFRWLEGEAAEHYQVDDGEGRAMKKAAALLRPDTARADGRIPAELAARRGELETETARLITGKVREYLAARQHSQE